MWHIRLPQWFTKPYFWLSGGNLSSSPFNPQVRGFPLALNRPTKSTHFKEIWNATFKSVQHNFLMNHLVWKQTTGMYHMKLRSIRNQITVSFMLNLRYCLKTVSKTNQFRLHRNKCLRSDPMRTKTRLFTLSLLTISFVQCWTLNKPQGYSASFNYFQFFFEFT